MLASTSVPIATTAVSNSFAPSWRIACSSVESASTTCVSTPGELLHELRVRVDAQHLVAHADERLREPAAEAAQPDDDEFPCCH